MPFRTANTLPDLADVKIFFSGLMFFRPSADGSACEVCPHRGSPDHRLSIEVRQKALDPHIPDLILMRHLGLVEYPALDIGIVPATVEGVKQFLDPISPIGPAFDRSNGHANAADFRFAIDLENPEFHQRPLKLDKNYTTPTIELTDGTFYSAITTDETKLTVTRKLGGKTDLVLHRIAAALGTNIYLPVNSSLVLNWAEGGVPRVQVLPKPRANDRFSYEIYISNDPLFVDMNNRDEVLKLHDEFEEYYKAIKDLPPAVPFKLDFQDHLGTPSIPCMPVVGGTDET